MAQLGQLSDSLERARSQYDMANAKLAQIQRDLRENRRELRLAKHNLKVGERTIAQRLVALYTSDQESTLEVVLGAKSLDDMITRIDNAKSVTQADTDVLTEVKHFRAVAKHSGDVLKRAHQQQAQVVAERAAAKRDIENKIA
ncbi:MAG: coiled-coil domain-containing protein, partial [Gaiellaceae bacterium]